MRQGSGYIRQSIGVITLANCNIFCSEILSIQTVRHRAPLHALRLCAAGTGGLLLTEAAMLEFKPNRVQGQRERRMTIQDILRGRIKDTYVSTRPWLQEIDSLLLEVATDPKDKITTGTMAGTAPRMGCIMDFYPSVVLDKDSRARCNSKLFLF